MEGAGQAPPIVIPNWQTEKGSNPLLGVWSAVRCPLRYRSLFVDYIVARSTESTHRLSSLKRAHETTGVCGAEKNRRVEPVLREYRAVFNDLEFVLEEDWASDGSRTHY